ncbi:phosphate ABC transporter permease subunit PstC [Nitrospiraceae bacterium HYJII51-Mn-bac16s-1-B09]|uniref:Phosphate transport system permease protein n=1 Tax=Candidatus Manganitrophus noduliformans TaxID=2606439 RepID=A0A7X6DMS3_9BACT|nr:phosphate ABC transporter permease subunit PstC [Candidatus Manganitrophus noduliformans]
MYARRLQKAGESVIEGALLLSALLSVFITLGIIGVLLFETLSFFGEVSIIDFLTDTQWTPLFAEKHFGILPLFAGTFLTTFIAMAVSLPIGLISAIYLSEYASDRVRTTIKPFLEILAAVPTVVYGYFALLFVTPLLQKFFPEISGFNALSPGIVMGIMIIPIISSLSEDAMHAVPIGLREGGYALGSTRLQVALRVVLPAAFSGVAASFILGISRAVGETMIVAVAAGLQPRLTLNPFVPIETVTAYIVQVSLGDTPYGTIEYRTIFAAGMSLFVVTFVLNMISYSLRKRFREVYE